MIDTERTAWPVAASRSRSVTNQLNARFSVPPDGPSLTNWAAGCVNVGVWLTSFTVNVTVRLADWLVGVNRLLSLIVNTTLYVYGPSLSCGTQVNWPLLAVRNVLKKLASCVAFVF